MNEKHLIAIFDVFNLKMIFDNDNEKIDGDFEFLYDNNIVEDEVIDVNIFQSFTQ